MNNFDKLTEEIITLLKNPNNWERPWIKVNDLAKNAHTDRIYDVWGWNQIILSYYLFTKNYRFNRWLTFNQISNLGGRVKRGEKSTFIYFMDFIFKLTENNQKIDKKEVAAFQKQGKKISSIPFLKCYPVFNVDQTEGLPEEYFIPLHDNKEVSDSCNLAAETILKAFSEKIVLKEIGKAFYDPKSDLITAPFKGYFKDPEGFYLSIFHEIAHLTGHSSRLNRELKSKKESENYAFEELVAELTATFVGCHCGINNKIQNSATYINSWLQELKDDTKYIFKAMKLAKEAANFILEHAGVIMTEESVKQELEVS